jgi:hypothetical protein
MSNANDTADQWRAVSNTQLSQSIKILLKRGVCAKPGLI